MNDLILLPRETASTKITDGSSGANRIPDNVGEAFLHAPEPTSLPAHALIPITISRDLSVQIVGSDAGKARRFRPQGLMTRGATPEEIAAVEELMQPFLQDEIKRFHEARNHHPAVFSATATIAQANALKGFCLRYAAHICRYLDSHNHDPRHHRSQQRLDQANAVIAQINTAFNTPFDDGLTLQDCIEHSHLQVESLERQLALFEQRLNAKRTSWPDLGVDGERLLRIKQAIAFQPAMADILGIEMTPTTTEGSDTRGSA